MCCLFHVSLSHVTKGLLPECTLQTALSITGSQDDCSACVCSECAGTISVLPCTHICRGVRVGIKSKSGRTWKGERWRQWLAEACTNALEMIESSDQSTAQKALPLVSHRTWRWLLWVSGKIGSTRDHFREMKVQTVWFQIKSWQSVRLYLQMYKSGYLWHIHSFHRFTMQAY